MSAVCARALVVAVALLALAGCAGDPATVVGTDTASVAPDDVQPSTEPDVPAPTGAPAPSDAPTAGPGPADSAPSTGEQPPATNGSGPAPAPGADCSAAGFTGSVNTTGAPAPAAATATALFGAAKACDSATLIAKAQTSATVLSRTQADATQTFALPDADNRYRELVTALSQPPGQADGEVVWPKAAADPTGAYSGYIVSVNSSGSWTAFYK